MPFRFSSGAPSQGMNTNTLPTFLLALMTATLSAQTPRLEASVTKDQLHAKVHNVHEASLVVLVIGLERAQLRLPGNQILGIEPALVSFAAARAPGSVELNVNLGAPPSSAIEVFVQAVAIDPRVPLDAPSGITLSAVCPLQVHQTAR